MIEQRSEQGLTLDVCALEILFFFLLLLLDVFMLCLNNLFTFRAVRQHFSVYHFYNNNKDICLLFSANSPCTVSSGSQESYNPDLDPTSHLHGHPDPSQGYPPRGFNFQPPASSTAQIISHGVFPPNLQVAPGFNPMYHVGPMSAAVLPSQQAMSPRPGLSPVMILQRGSGGSPGQVHPHPGFISQGFGGQAPGAYQGQGSQGQK